MNAPAGSILVLNIGSSSIKCEVFNKSDATKLLYSASVQGIGLGDAYMRMQSASDESPERIPLPPDTTHTSAIDMLITKLGSLAGDSLSAIGYRVVHGGELYSEPTIVTPQVIDDLSQLAYLAPEHLPLQTTIMRKLFAARPTALHIACFDTAFHHAMPRVAQQTSLPREFESLGLRRYGFHGLSYEYLSKRVKSLTPPERNYRNIIFAHLGNGASLAAVQDGKPMDTSMGMTPASGIMMSTRSGDIDPGIIEFLARQGGTTIDHFDTIVNEQSGLLGVSGTSGDMRKLLSLEQSDTRAREAVGLFCYQVKKCIGAYSAVLGGLDALIFSGGIGEQAPIIRERVCEGLAFLGIALDNESNQMNATIISAPPSPVTVFVIPTDEGRMIAEHVAQIMKHYD